MKKIFKLQKTYLALVILFGITSCTNLEIEGTDSLIQETPDFQGVEDPASTLTAVYQSTYGMLGDQANFFALNEVTTDETLVPTRGTDWGDNGQWRQLHDHTMRQDHAFLITTWNQLNGNAFRATEIIDPLSGASSEVIAQAKFLRAFNMFFVLDFWGIAPFRNATDASSFIPIVMDAATTYDFILTDLNDAIAGLPTVGPSDETSRANKAAANYLKAKLILNGERYTGSAPNYQEVISAVDAIAADGFGLQAGYFDLFNPSVDTETIWFANESLGVGNRIWNGMHYSINSPDNEGGGWNGFSTLSEFYDTFEGASNTNNVGDGQEERRGWVPDASNANNTDNYGIGYGFLVGQQYNADGSKLEDRVGNDLVFTREQSFTNSNEASGIRIIKYHPNDGAGNSASFRSHEIIFRYADAHLMKAEAMMRSGGDATAMVNTLRVLRGATSLGSVSEAEMLDERGRELYYELWRRNDMLRFDQYTRDWEFKDPSTVGDANKNLFPIPLAALVSNPNLTQNPGY